MFGSGRSFDNAFVTSHSRGVASKEPVMSPATTKSLSRRRAARGQGMTEYIIIVALIAIAAIGVITLFGDNLRKLFGVAADAIAGEESTTPATKTFKASNTDTKKTLSTFAEKNNANY